MEPIQPESNKTVLAQHHSVLGDLIKNGKDYVERQKRVTKGREMQLACFEAHANYVSYLEENPDICKDEPEFVKTQLAILSSVIQPAPLQQETAVSEPALQQNQCVFCNKTYASSNSLQKHKLTCPAKRK
jgi:hypothetical protein